MHYDARPNKSQDLRCKTSKTDIPVQEDLYYDARPNKSQDVAAHCGTS